MNGDGAHNYTYDTLNRLVDALNPLPSNPQESYVYDPVGNRTNSNQNGASDGGTRTRQAPLRSSGLIAGSRPATRQSSSESSITTRTTVARRESCLMVSVLSNVAHAAAPHPNLCRGTIESMGILLGSDPSTRAPALAGALAQDSAPPAYWKVTRGCPCGSTKRCLALRGCTRKS